MSTAAGLPPNAAVRLWHRSRGTALVAVANLSVAATIALVTALLALVVEDALPVGIPRHVSGPRLGWLAVSVVLLAVAVVWRAAVHRNAGTLVYVRLLDQAVHDWHASAVDLAGRRRLALRAATRWVDLRAHTHPDMIDVTVPCAGTAADLRAALLATPADARCTIAPNLLWPMALAVGAELPPVKHLRILELAGSDAARQPREVVFAPPRLPAPPGLVQQVLHVGNVLPLPGHAAGSGRLGVLLAFGKNAVNMDPVAIFTAFGVGETCTVRPSWMAIDALGPNSFNGDDLARLTQALTAHLVDVKEQARRRELVLAAAMPKALAFAIGHGLAQYGCRFFAGTHLLHYNGDNRYLPMRVHTHNRRPNPPEAPLPTCPAGPTWLDSRASGSGRSGHADG